MGNKQELAIKTKKEENISEWYTEVIKKGDLIDYTKVSGCIVYKPRIYEIWENIQKFFDKRIKKSGVRNCYFPVFIPESLLVKEEEHVEDFAPEVAWVTHGGDTKLGERLAVRPTSETIMYDSYSKWIQSYRDLPLRLNQWNNVVRWEFKHPTPLLRGREFLWQEGHSAFATEKEAIKEVYEILEYYRQVYEDLLAIPVTLGRKSEKEKFAGAEFSLTAEPFSYIEGKVIQACTSHHLGQKFSKAFNIKFFNKEQKKEYVWQNSWGLSTRSLGTMILIHGDDKGLVIPPKVAVEKAVIIPLFFKGKEEKVLEKSREIKELLLNNNINTFIDDRKEYSPGWKFNEWELKGIPLRIEIGPRDLENNVIIVTRRDNFQKYNLKIDEGLIKNINELLENMHKNMFEKVKKEVEKNTVEVYNFKDFEKAIKNKKRCLVPWKEDIKIEEEIKEKTGAKTSCKPFEYKDRNLEGVKCFYTGKPADCWIYFSKSH